MLHLRQAQFLHPSTITSTGSSPSIFTDEVTDVPGATSIGVEVPKAGGGGAVDVLSPDGCGGGGSGGDADTPQELGKVPSLHTCYSLLK